VGVGTWAVVRVNDDGRLRVVRDGMKPDAALEQAGRMRDRQSDDDVGDGWSVLAMGAADVARRQRSARAGAPTPAAGKSETVWLGRVSADYSRIESK
jgi:hypothetical protein